MENSVVDKIRVKPLDIIFLKGGNESKTVFIENSDENKKMYIKLCFAYRSKKLEPYSHGIITQSIVGLSLFPKFQEEICLLPKEKIEVPVIFNADKYESTNRGVVMARLIISVTSNSSEKTDDKKYQIPILGFTSKPVIDVTKPDIAAFKRELNDYLLNNSERVDFYKTCEKKFAESFNKIIQIANTGNGPAFVVVDAKISGVFGIAPNQSKSFILLPQTTKTLFPIFGPITIISGPLYLKFLIDGVMGRGEYAEAIKIFKPESNLIEALSLVTERITCNIKEIENKDLYLSQNNEESVNNKNQNNVYELEDKNQKIKIINTSPQKKTNDVTISNELAQHTNSYIISFDAKQNQQNAGKTKQFQQQILPKKSYDEFEEQMIQEHNKVILNELKKSTDGYRDNFKLIEDNDFIEKKNEKICAQYNIDSEDKYDYYEIERKTEMDKIISSVNNSNNYESNTTVTTTCKLGSDKVNEDEYLNNNTNKMLKYTLQYENPLGHRKQNTNPPFYFKVNEKKFELNSSPLKKPIILFKSEDLSIVQLTGGVTVKNNAILPEFYSDLLSKINSSNNLTAYEKSALIGHVKTNISELAKLKYSISLNSLSKKYEGCQIELSSSEPLIGELYSGEKKTIYITLKIYSYRSGRCSFSSSIDEIDNSLFNNAEDVLDLRVFCTRFGKPKDLNIETMTLEEKKREVRFNEFLHSSYVAELFTQTVSLPFEYSRDLIKNIKSDFTGLQKTLNFEYIEAGTDMPDISSSILFNGLEYMESFYNTTIELPTIDLSNPPNKIDEKANATEIKNNQYEKTNTIIIDTKEFTPKFSNTKPNLQNGYKSEVIMSLKYPTSKTSSYNKYKTLQSETKTIDDILLKNSIEKNKYKDDSEAYKVTITPICTECIKSTEVYNNKGMLDDQEVTQIFAANDFVLGGIFNYDINEASINFSRNNNNKIFTGSYGIGNTLSIQARIFKPAVDKLRKILLKLKNNTVCIEQKCELLIVPPKSIYNEVLIYYITVIVPITLRNPSLLKLQPESYVNTANTNGINKFKNTTNYSKMHQRQLTTANNIAIRHLNMEEINGRAEYIYTNIHSINFPSVLGGANGRPSYGSFILYNGSETTLAVSLRGLQEPFFNSTNSTIIRIEPYSSSEVLLTFHPNSTNISRYDSVLTIQVCNKTINYNIFIELHGESAHSPLILSQPKSQILLLQKNTSSEDRNNSNINSFNAQTIAISSTTKRGSVYLRNTTLQSDIAYKFTIPEYYRNQIIITPISGVIQASPQDTVEGIHKSIVEIRWNTEKSIKGIFVVPLVVEADFNGTDGVSRSFTVFKGCIRLI